MGEIITSFVNICATFTLASRRQDTAYIRGLFLSLIVISTKTYLSFSHMVSSIFKAAENESGQRYASSQRDADEPQSPHLMQITSSPEFPPSTKLMTLRNFGLESQVMQSLMMMITVFSFYIGNKNYNLHQYTIIICDIGSTLYTGRAPCAGGGSVNHWPTNLEPLREPLRDFKSRDLVIPIFLLPRMLP